MKKVLYLVCALVSIAVCSCVPPQQQRLFVNHEQGEFDSLMQVYYNKHISAHNDIVDKELGVEYKAKIDSFLTENKIDGWVLLFQGLKVEDVTLSDTLYKRVSFDLINGLDATPKLTINATYLTKAETCAQDSTYNKLKNIGNLDKVSFTGYALKYDDGFVSDNPLSMSYLDFNCIIKDISKQQ